MQVFKTMAIRIEQQIIVSSQNKGQTVSLRLKRLNSKGKP